MAVALLLMAAATQTWLVAVMLQVMLIFCLVGGVAVAVAVAFVVLDAAASAAAASAAGAAASAAGSWLLHAVRARPSAIASRILLIDMMRIPRL